MGRRIYKIGSDMDGVLCYWEKFPTTKSFFKMKGDERKRKWAWEERAMRNAKPLLLSKFLNDFRNFVIITARKECDRKVTEEWLAKHNANHLKVYYNNLPITRDAITQFKAETINRLKIEIFFEDDIIIAKRLLMLCPNCLISFIESKCQNKINKS